MMDHTSNMRQTQLGLAKKMRIRSKEARRHKRKQQAYAMLHVLDKGLFIASPQTTPSAKKSSWPILSKLGFFAHPLNAMDDRPEQNAQRSLAFARIQ